MTSLIDIGKSADDLRFFIRFHGRHAGGITVHSVRGDTFSYGILVVPSLRGRGIARDALEQLFALMRARGFARAVVSIAPDNTASLALHRSLGFAELPREAGVVRMERELDRREASPVSTAGCCAAYSTPRKSCTGFTAGEYRCAP